MRRRPLLAVLLAAGCASEPASRPPDLEPYSTGVTAYTVVADEDFLDDASMLGDIMKDPRPVFFGEQGFHIALRAISRGRQVVLQKVDHFEAREARPVRREATQPAHYFVRSEGDRYALRESGHREGFIGDFTFVKGPKEGYVDVEYRLTYRNPSRRRIEGTSFEAGEPVMEDVPVASGKKTIPARAALMFGTPAGPFRRHLYFLHVASVEPR